MKGICKNNKRREKTLYNEYKVYFEDAERNERVATIVEICEEVQKDLA
ncbi:MAG: hypothetical protein ACTSQE_15400 [Candidatus Heimdallarchaeaceae archaeon]